MFFIMRMEIETTGAAHARRALPPGRGSLLTALLLAVTSLCVSASMASAQVPRRAPAPPPEPFEITPWMEALNAGDTAAALEAAAVDRYEVRAYIEGRAAERRGAYPDALDHYRRAVARDVEGDAALALADLLYRFGERDEAREIWERLLAAGQRERSGARLSRAAQAAHRLGQVRLANSYFQTAATLLPGDPRLHTAWGDLFLEKYNDAEARASYDSALKIADRWVPALTGLARSLADTNPTAAERAARQVLAVDPAQPDALVLLATQAMDASQRDDARALLQQVLAVNARHVEALALSAAIAQIEDDAEGVARFTREALAMNPYNGHVHRIIGERVARQYRFEEAVRFLREAVALEPGNSRAQASLGLHLLRTGDEAEARDALTLAFSADPFDAVTYNLLSLLDTLDGFGTFHANNLTVRLHDQDAPVLEQFLVPLAEEALETLSARYEFTPEGPILVEVFPRHDDFAVRTMGLPGMLGALGACFGKVVTMDSPRARPPGSFNWAATLWHELAHVITLQMSGNRLPRWLSEGISTFEEIRARPGWGLESQLLFAQAHAAGRLIPLEDLNAGFTRVETINLAYFQASVLVGHLVEAHGEERLRRFIRIYGEGKDDVEALRAVYDTDWTSLQGAFDTYVAGRYGAVRDALAEIDEKPPARAADAATWTAFADRHAGNFRVQLAAATPLMRLGELDEARRVLERAAELVPFATGDDSPWRLLASLAVRQEQPEQARAYMARLLEVDHTAAQPLRQLLVLAREAGDDLQRQQAASRLIEIDPFDAAAHSALGELALARGDVDAALRALRTAVEAGPPNPSEALTSLAEATLRSGDPSGAKEHLLRALESTPRYERAQELLLRVIDGLEPGGVQP